MEEQITITMTLEQLRVAMRIIEMAQEHLGQDLKDAGIYTESNRVFIILATAQIEYGHEKCDGQDH